MPDTKDISSEDFIGLSKNIYEIVSQHTFFPTPIILTQIKRLRKTPQQITVDDLPKLAEHIGQALANFTGPVKGAEVRAAIEELGRA